ncbi:MAG: divalent cation tolerance protein CutA [Bacteroidetes bacterium]|jgi:periplasmic divalent cation tolerance protein|nr:divalent cation tolerance protein CutA [Bacteroidota bacterium]
MKDVRLLYITTENVQEARSIGGTLVKEQLCACVNILDTMESVYWWKDELQMDAESVMLVKTTKEMVPKVTERIKELHSYDVPCVISVPLSPGEGNQSYLDWIANAVRRT